MPTLLDIERAARRALIPPPKLDLPTWIEANVRLPSSVSAVPGALRLSPVQWGIAEAIGDPSIERVTLVKPVRLGLTTLITSTVASYIANEPSPILALLPTESDCRDYVVSDIEPIFDASPELRGLLSGDVDETGRSTLLSRKFPGGSLKIVAAKSPRNLRRHNVRILLIDEADAMESGPEGSPITLAERRTLSFPNRKIIMGSTPIYEEASHVLRAYRESDQRIFEVCCPSCGAFQQILWRHIQWPEGEPERAYFICEAHGCIVEERQKGEMVAKGRWRAMRPELKGHAGFRCNVLVSTLANASWGKIAREFLTAKRNVDQLQTWTNTLLAEGWREAAEEVDESALASRVEPFGLAAMPADVLIVTAGVDVQRDRLEIVFIGHGRDELFILGNAVIWGLPEDDPTWAELDELLKSTWQHPNGGTLRVDAAAVDAGDGATMDRVLSFCQPRFGRRVVAIKGASGNRPAIAASATKGSRLFIVGVDGEKSRLLARLSRAQGIRFSRDLEPRYFEEIASERVVVRYTRGVPNRLWERKPGLRAECLDATVYAIAVRGLLHMNLERRTEELASAAAPAPRLPNVIKSAWLNR
ncbi:phage terminase large subunit family protein [Ancylobacter defluvii]|uniref:Terminase n=1 Tax=Ancylobacter defluvii TaxID=1282440 RepID=A0A9W6NBF7_9HYPH|nr:terminase gpA endonuclease subunit [Ancylobacter defluvii]MBS7589049.1 phage terminase large subunit family protein [Ancylobacter defluvii]GLK84658.1 terminase [Ancylobacter defluvii]